MPAALGRSAGSVLVVSGILEPAAVQGLENSAGPNGGALFTAANYAVTQTTVTIPRRGGGTLSATLFAPQPTFSIRFPAVVFAHGLGGPVTVYGGTLAYLAAHGFYVLAPQGGIVQGCDGAGNCDAVAFDLFVSDCADAADWAILQPNVDSSRGVGWMGHSLGGGAIVYSAQRSRAVAGAFALMAPCNGNPCGWQNAFVRGVCTPGMALNTSFGSTPLHILVGDRDANSVCTADRGGAPMFLASRRATLSLQRHATHCYTELPVDAFGSECNQASLDNSGSAATRGGRLDADVLEYDSLGIAANGGANLGMTQQISTARRRIAAVFLYHLSGVGALEAAVWGTGTSAAPWTFTDAGMSLIAVRRR